MHACRSTLEDPTVAIKLRSRWRADHWGSVTPSASEPGRYQLTHHDERGPSGHTCRDTIAEALEEEVEAVEPHDHHEAVAAVAEVEARARTRAARVEDFLASV